jgi:hypothetical protein
MIYKGIFYVDEIFETALYNQTFDYPFDAVENSDNLNLEEFRAKLWEKLIAGGGWLKQCRFIDKSEMKNIQSGEIYKFIYIKEICPDTGDIALIILDHYQIKLKVAL